MSKTLSKPQCVMVTGAAQGIGAAIAAKLLQQGHRVLLTDIAPLDSFKSAIDAYPSEQAIGLGGIDVSDESSWRQALAVAE